MPTKREMATITTAKVVTMKFDTRVYAARRLVPSSVHEAQRVVVPRACTTELVRRSRPVGKGLGVDLPTSYTFRPRATRAGST